MDKILDRLKARGADKKPGGLVRRVSRILNKEEVRRHSILVTETTGVKEVGTVPFGGQHEMEQDTAEDASEACDDDEDIGKCLAEEDEEEEYETARTSSQEGDNSHHVHFVADVVPEEDCILKGKAVAIEARRLYHQYLSGKSDSGQAFEWTEKMNKKGVVVHSSPVAGSTWLAIRAVTSIQANVKTTLNFLLDDSRMVCELVI
jgi:hypothetical protein